MKKREKSQYRNIAYSAIIVALAVTLGYALAAVPNVELVTFTLALGGALLGPGRGAAVGAMGFGLYSALSPYGIAPPPVYIAQLIGGAAIGLMGGVLTEYIAKKPRGIRAVLSGMTGAGLAFIYDLLTNLGSFFAVGADRAFLPFIIGGIGFSLVHIGANALIFALLLPLFFRIFDIAGKSPQESSE